MEGMEGFWFIIVIIGWVISAVSKAKKKQESQQKTRTGQSPVNRPQPAQPRNKNGSWVNGRWISAEEAVRTAGGDKDIFPPARQPAAPQAVKPAASPAHHAEPLVAHMHVPEMGVEGEGTEGMDCCHEYMLNQTPEAESPDIPFLTEENDDERAAALLQGVIFSEILGRRPIKRYGGHRA